MGNPPSPLISLPQHPRTRSGPEGMSFLCVLDADIDLVKSPPPIPFKLNHSLHPMLLSYSFFRHSTNTIYVLHLSTSFPDCLVPIESLGPRNRSFCHSIAAVASQLLTDPRTGGAGGGGAGRGGTPHVTATPPPPDPPAGKERWLRPGWLQRERATNERAPAR